MPTSAPSFYNSRGERIDKPLCDLSFEDQADAVVAHIEVTITTIPSDEQIQGYRDLISGLLQDARRQGVQAALVAADEVHDRFFQEFLKRGSPSDRMAAGVSQAKSAIEALLD